MFFFVIFSYVFISLIKNDLNCDIGPKKKRSRKPPNPDDWQCEIAQCVRQNILPAVVLLSKFPVNWSKTLHEVVYRVITIQEGLYVYLRRRINRIETRTYYGHSVEIKGPCARFLKKPLHRQRCCVNIFGGRPTDQPYAERGRRKILMMYIYIYVCMSNKPEYEPYYKVL